MRASLSLPLCALAWTAAMSVAAPQAAAQDWLRQAIPPEQRSHDFGTVARAAKTEHRFEITNVHDTDLHIRSVRASCGCTTPIVEDSWIRPGEKGTILARYNTGTFTGRRSATLTITIDKPYFTELQLNVRGYIRSDVVLHPGEINFGEVPVGSPHTMEIALDYAGRSDWQIVGVENPMNFLDVAVDEVSRESGRVKYKISARLKENAPAEFLQNQIVLKTNDRNLTTVPVMFVANVQAPIQVSPQALALGTVKPGEPIQKRVVVKGRSPFRILDIRSDTLDVRYEPLEEAKQAHLINLVVTPPAAHLEGDGAQEQQQAEITILTDLIEEPVRLMVSYDIAIQSGTALAPSVVQAR